MMIDTQGSPNCPKAPQPHPQESSAFLPPDRSATSFSPHAHVAARTLRGSDFQDWQALDREAALHWFVLRMKSHRAQAPWLRSFRSRSSRRKVRRARYMGRDSLRWPGNGARLHARCGGRTVAAIAASRDRRWIGRTGPGRSRGCGRDPRSRAKIPCRASRDHSQRRPFSNDLGIALRTHGGIWLAIGAAAGLAWVSGSARRVEWLER